MAQGQINNVLSMDWRYRKEGAMSKQTSPPARKAALDKYISLELPLTAPYSVLPPTLVWVSIGCSQLLSASRTSGPPLTSQEFQSKRGQVCSSAKRGRATDMEPIRKTASQSSFDILVFFFVRVGPTPFDSGHLANSGAGNPRVAREEGTWQRGTWSHGQGGEWKGKGKEGGGKGKASECDYGCKHESIFSYVGLCACVSVSVSVCVCVYVFS